MTTMKERVDKTLESIRSTALACGRDPESVLLIGVSKKKPASAIREGVEAGLQNLGENYIQEAMEKIDSLKGLKAAWHFIGHLQSNKARFAVRYFDLIHTVDTLKLAREINKQAGKIQKIQDVLMQINIGREETKSGAEKEDALKLAADMAALPNIRLMGLMGMPPFFDEPERARPYFKAIAEIRTAIEKKKIAGISMKHLSMGMSGDYKVAVEEGATMVRIGTAIFGSRP